MKSILMNGLSVDAMMNGCRNVAVKNNIAQGNTGYGIFVEKAYSLTAQNNISRYNNVNNIKIIN